jgi:hypothetical protein
MAKNLNYQDIKRAVREVRAEEKKEDGFGIQPIVIPQFD